MLDRRTWSPWLATLLTGAVCLSVWQMISCPGPPGAVLLPGLVSPPAYSLLTAANVSSAELPYDLERLPADDYVQLVNLPDFQFSMLSGACNETDGPLLLVLVHSAPGNWEKRATIRATWGEARDGLRLVFLLGDAPAANPQLQAEHARYGDLVQGNFVDAYRNMTYKHVMALKFAAYHCSRARYVLKTDDDVFVNMPTVMAFLHAELSAQGARRLLLCRPLLSSSAKRSFRSKWRVSFREYPLRQYPPYCPGWAVLYSPDVVFRLYREAQRCRYFWIDDVLITGILAKQAGLEHTPVPQQLVLTEAAVADLVLHSHNRSRALPAFLYGPPDMRPDDIHALWRLVTRGALPSTPLP